MVVSAEPGRANATSIPIAAPATLVQIRARRASTDTIVRCTAVNIGARREELESMKPHRRNVTLVPSPPT